jgi:hypothetical protein
VELGSAVYCNDWGVISFKARSAYSIDRQVFNLPVLPPAPMSMRRQHEIDRIPFARMVNAVFNKYDALKFADLTWSYWHALCAAPHIASAHFGAAIEMLLRQHAATKPDQFPQRIIADRSMWASISVQVVRAISKLQIDEAKKDAVRKNVGGLNRVHQRDVLDSILKDIGIELGADESQAWKRRNEAAHGIAIVVGEELDVIRDIKLLKVMFHRLLLRMTNGADSYLDYATPGFPIRRLADPVPSVG